MFYLGIIMTITSLWIAYEIWRAPLLEQNDDGKFITKRPTKKLKDLWRKES